MSRKFSEVEINIQGPWSTNIYRNGNLSMEGHRKEISNLLKLERISYFEYAPVRELEIYRFFCNHDNPSKHADNDECLYLWL
jgi:hypothetical protein